MTLPRKNKTRSKAAEGAEAPRKGDNMPRPGSNMGRPGSAVKTSANPFANWLAARKERKNQAEEQASRMITNRIAENESIIIDQLNSIDFLHSRLPAEVLHAKSRETQPCGDLEYASRAIVHMLLKTKTISWLFRPVIPAAHQMTKAPFLLLQKNMQLLDAFCYAALRP